MVSWNCSPPSLRIPWAKVRCIWLRYVQPPIVQRSRIRTTAQKSILSTEYHRQDHNAPQHICIFLLEQVRYEQAVSQTISVLLTRVLPKRLIFTTPPHSWPIVTWPLAENNQSEWFLNLCQFNLMESMFFVAYSFWSILGMFFKTTKWTLKGQDRLKSDHIHFYGC